jgi:release factor glutamine methyltransferase
MSETAVPASLATEDQLAWAVSRLEPVTATARLEAELLLAELAGLRRAAVIAHPERNLSAEQASRLAAVVARRRRGEPLAYIVGHKEFFSLGLSVRADVLVPRPETELLVEAALSRLPGGTVRVLDLGTGSGAIALALKNERPELAVFGVDCEQAALVVAAENAAALGLDVRWIRSDWFSALDGEQFALIVSNPPYVRTDDAHFNTGLAHEPRIALDGGPDGLDAYRRILLGASAHLVRDGWLIFEHGFDQRDALTVLAAASGFRLEAGIEDLAGLPRVACFQKVGV